VPPITELARGGTLEAMIDDWIAELERDAPDIVGAWRGIEVGQLLTVRREVRRRGGAGSAERIVGQLEATMAALTAIVAELPEEHPTRRFGEEKVEMLERLGYSTTKALEGPLEPPTRIGWETIPSHTPLAKPPPPLGE